MSLLIIKPGEPIEEHVLPSYKIANDAKTLPFLGGFTPQGQISDWYGKANEKIHHNVVAELDGEVQGFSISMSRHTHYLEFGFIGVDPEYRQQRIGTSLYFFHVLRAALSGRFFVKDQYIHFNEVMTDHFAPFNELEKVVELRHRIRNFSTLVWYLQNLTPESIERWHERCSSPNRDVEIQIVDRDSYLQNYNNVVKSLGDQGRDELRETVEANRQLALSLVWESKE